MDQLKGLLKIDQDLLKMKCEEWGGGAPGPCFPNPGTLAAMPSMRSPEVNHASFLDLNGRTSEVPNSRHDLESVEHIFSTISDNFFTRVQCILETLRLQLCGLEV